MNSDYIPFSKIVAELEKLCRQKVTGTLFVATKGNRSAQVMLDRGEIVYIYFFNKRGEEALALMSTVNAGKFRFQEGAVSRRTPLPSTDAIIRTLSGEQTSSTSSTQIVEKPSKEGGLGQEEMTVLETCLAGYIGPMAGIICEDHFGTAASLQAVVDALAAEIPSTEQAEKFRASVLEKLG